MRRIFNILVLWGGLLLLFLGGGIIWYAYQPLSALDNQLEISITAGSNLRQISRKLGTELSIPQESLWLAARLTEQDKQIKSGIYTLRAGMSLMDVLDLLIAGQVTEESLTIPEGWNLRQMRQLLDGHPRLQHRTVLWSDRRLIEELSKGGLTEKAGKESAQPSLLVYVQDTAEGLFFPDTYFFAPGSSDLTIFRRAWQAMERHIYREWSLRDDAYTPYKNPYEAIIMASIVEKETGRAHERPHIAGVFVNRLNKGMLLQTDPTVIYGLGDKYDGKIHKIDLQTDTPYNTYTRTGLPPTPIALPGLEAIRAALRPLSTDDLYFVAKGDGTHVFSQTLEAHNAAVNRYQRGISGNVEVKSARK